MKLLSFITKQNFILLIIVFISGLFMSPKWTLLIAPWVYYTFLLRYVRLNNWKGILFVLPFLIMCAFFAQIKVMPMGYGTVLVMMSIGTIIGVLPFVVDKIMYQKLPRWAGSLIFPVALTGFNYLFDQGPQGTLGNTAYTQFSWLSFMQLASVTGIYGINFLIYWFASTANECYDQIQNRKKLQWYQFSMPFCFFIAILFGMVRLNSPSQVTTKAKMATITMDNLRVTKAMYEVAFDKKMVIPIELNQSDPIIQEAQKGIIAFMDNPAAEKYIPVYNQMDAVFSDYIAATKEAAEKGAKVITWSEAAIINIKDREREYEQRIAKLADALDVYIFFPTAVFHPEKVGKEALFIENKVLTFGPDGLLLNTYFKNVPVMGVEPSFPGDGKIPVIETPYGNLSPIICYDADHPSLIAQVQDQNTEVLVVPTGDWKAISPYHTEMAAVRCIENGISMIKSSSHGLSAFIDDKGRIVASESYFNDRKVKSIIYDLPVSTSSTMYQTGFPLFINFIGVSFTCFLISFIVLTFAKWKIGQELRLQLKH